MDYDFISSMWNQFLKTFGIVLALNRGCSSIFEEVLLNPLFHDKGRVHWIFFLLCYRVFGLRGIMTFFVGWNGLGRNFEIRLNVFPLYGRLSYSFGMMSSVLG